MLLLKIKFQVLNVAYMAVHNAALTYHFSLLFKTSMSLPALGLCKYLPCYLDCPSAFSLPHQLLLICRAQPKVTSLERPSWITQPKLGPHGYSSLRALFSSYIAMMVISTYIFIDSVILFLPIFSRKL